MLSFGVGVLLYQVLPAFYRFISNYTKYNFIIGQCVLAEIMCHGFERKLLVNTGWPIYKVQSVLKILYQGWQHYNILRQF